jgi:hypothetical protein
MAPAGGGADTRAMPDALTETRLVHDAHRRATTLLVDAAGGPSPVVGDLRDFLVAALHHHHETEDEVLWPIITGTAPELAAAFRDLSAEHDRLGAALERLAGADDVGPAAIEVRDLVHGHLDHEEPILFPALRNQVSPAVWDAFSQHVIATAPVEGMHLLLGLFDQVGAPDDVATVLSALPRPAQAMVPALRAQGAAALAELAP